MDTAQEGACEFMRSPRAQFAECLLKREMFPILLFCKYEYCDYGDNRGKARDGAKIALCVISLNVSSPRRWVWCVRRGVPRHPDMSQQLITVSIFCWLSASFCYFAWPTLVTWRWSRYVTPKRRALSKPRTLYMVLQPRRHHSSFPNLFKLRWI